MKAIVYEEPKRLVLRELARPEPGAGEVLLLTRAVGICGSDVHGYLGLTGRRIPPLVMGHEVVGEVVALGAGASSEQRARLQSGTLVAVNPLMTCGTCQMCRRGDDNVCLLRKGLGMLTVAGAMSEYFVAPIANLVPLPDGVAPAQGALAEPLAVGLHAWAVLCRSLHLGRRPGARVAVIGAGMIGLAALVALPDSIRQSAVVCDLRQNRLDRIRALLPDIAIENTASTPWAEIRNRHAPEGFDAVFEAVGRSATAAASVELASRGGVVVWIGNWEPTVAVPMQVVVTNEVTIHGSYGFTAEEFRTSAQRLSASPWTAQVVDAVLPLDAAPAAFEELAAGQTGALKIVLDPTARQGPSR